MNARQTPDYNHDQSQRDVPEHPRRTFRPRLLPHQAHAAGARARRRELQAAFGRQGPERRRQCAGAVCGDVPPALRLGRDLSSRLRPAHERDHGRHAELHRHRAGDADQRSRHRLRNSMIGSKRAAWLLTLGALVIGLQGCAVLPPPAEREPSVAMPASPNEPLGRIALQSVPAGLESGFRPLPLATWSMDARLTLVREARTSLDLQCYLLQNDVTGHTLARAVRDAAVRGVRVRLLVDDLYTADNMPMLLGLAAYPNVEVRLFNPFAGGRGFGLTRWLVGLNEFSRINHRMHNKLMVADGAF